MTRIRPEMLKQADAVSHATDKGLPYTFTDAYQLLSDFFEEGGSDCRGSVPESSTYDLPGIWGSLRYYGGIGHAAPHPDGMPRKLLDLSRLHEVGWWARIPVEDGFVTPVGGI